MKVDVVVVGSGAGALVAAAVAAAAGAEVRVLEKSSKLGGGSALSTGLVFAPDNSYMRAAGIADSREVALRYLTRLNGGLATTERLDRFLTNQASLLDWLATEASMRFRAILDLPDFGPDSRAVVEAELVREPGHSLTRTCAAPHDRCWAEGSASAGWASLAQSRGLSKR